MPAIKKVKISNKAKATFQSLARSPLEGYFNSVSTFRPNEKQELLSRELPRPQSAQATPSHSSSAT